MIKKIFNNIVDVYHEIKSVYFEWDTFTLKRKWETLFNISHLSASLIGLNMYNKKKIQILLDSGI